MTLPSNNQNHADHMACRNSSPSHGRNDLLLILALLYSILVVYGSLYPFSGWTNSQVSPFAFLTTPAPDHLSRADLLTNLIAYFPLGLLLVVAFVRWSPATAVVFATAYGASLSFVMEAVQTFLPARTSSKIDFVVNVAGTLAGTCVGLSCRDTSKLRINMRQVRDTWFEKGVAVDVALVAAVLWAASQLSPFVPSMDVSSIADAVRPLRITLSLPGTVSVAKIAIYSLNITAVGLLVSVAARRSRNARVLFMVIGLCVLLVKPLIVTRQLTLESLVGFAIASGLLLLLPQARALATLTAMACVLSAYVIGELAPAGVASALHAFNWIPFAGQLDDTVSGFGSILDTVWPVVALASLAMLGFGRKRGPMITIGTLLVAVVFACEWMQRVIEGRYGDITPVLLTAAAWMLAWTYFFVNEPPQVRVRRRSHQQSFPSAQLAMTAPKSSEISAD